MEQSENDIKKRYKKTAYFICPKMEQMNSKREVERHLTKTGGLKEGYTIIKGTSVTTQKIMNFVIKEL